MITNNNVRTIDDYIKRYPEKVQAILQKIRITISETAPDATEKISYGIPTFHLFGNLIHFGAYEKFISLYPGAAPVKQFAKDLETYGYETSKGTIRFPVDKPIPYDLIRKITKVCVERNQAKLKK